MVVWQISAVTSKCLVDRSENIPRGLLLSEILWISNCIIWQIIAKLLKFCRIFFLQMHDKYFIQKIDHELFTLKNYLIISIFATQLWKKYECRVMCPPFNGPIRFWVMNPQKSAFIVKSWYLKMIVLPFLAVMNLIHYCCNPNILSSEFMDTIIKFMKNHSLKMKDEITTLY